MKKIVGFNRSKGTFIDKKTGEFITYDNINLYLISTSNSDSTLHGYLSSSEKVKYEVAEKVLGLPEKDWDKLINKPVQLEYTSGRFPKLESVVISE